MSFSEIVRERAAACAWCLKPTWNLSAVCNRRECRRLEDRYRIRRSSTGRDERGSQGLDTPVAAGPRDDAAAGHLVVPASPGAAFSDGERSGLPATARVSSLGDLSPSGLDRG